MFLYDSLLQDLNPQHIRNITDSTCHLDRLKGVERSPSSLTFGNPTGTPHLPLVILGFETPGNRASGSISVENGRQPWARSESKNLLRGPKPSTYPEHILQRDNPDSAFGLRHSHNLADLILL